MVISEINVGEIILRASIDRILDYNISGGFDMSGYNDANYRNMEILGKFKNYMSPLKNLDNRNPNFIFPTFWKGSCSLISINNHDDFGKNEYKGGYYEPSKILDGYENYSGGLESSQIIFDIITHQNSTILKDIEEELKETNSFIKTLTLQEKEDFEELTKREPMSKVITFFKRNKKIVEELKKLYNGKCQVKGCQFTFKKENGENFCETHHLHSLHNNGEDDIKNMVCICPNHHELLHYGAEDEKEKIVFEYKKEHYWLGKTKEKNILEGIYGSDKISDQEVEDISEYNE